MPSHTDRQRRDIGTFRVWSPKEALDAFAANIVSQVPLKRFGKPEEVEQTALFPASSASSYITAVELNVDGGIGQVWFDTVAAGPRDLMNEVFGL